MIKYEVYEGVFDMDFQDTSAALVDGRDKGRLRSIINNLNMYENNVKNVTEIYTNVFMDEQVSYFLPGISAQDVFSRHFPELYVYNEYGENLFNCEQDSKTDDYSVFYHTVESIKNANVDEIPIADWQKKVLKWTMFLHDIGKPYVKKVASDGTMTFDDCSNKSVELAKGILNRFNFSENEIDIICTLIKYHDMYTTSDETTEQNLTYLANGLNNNKELFYLLINVKDADAKAKNKEAYEEFKSIKDKYYEFAKKYFDISNKKKDESPAPKKTDEKEEAQEVATKKLTSKEIKEIIEDIITNKNVKVKYQPIVDIKTQNVYAYEALTQLPQKGVKIDKFIEAAKDFEDYDKMQQILFTNAIEQFESVVNKESNVLMVNIDYDSYDKYINKPRIYDMMSRNKIVIEFNNYENRDLTQIEETIQTIHLKGGKVAFDNFKLGNLTIEDICYLDLDYLIPDKSIIMNINTDFEKQKYIYNLITYTISKNVDLIAVGVENKKIFDTVKLVGVKLVQGYYFEKPSNEINMINEKIYELLNADEDQSIV